MGTDYESNHLEALQYVRPAKKNMLAAHLYGICIPKICTPSFLPDLGVFAETISAFIN